MQQSETSLKEALAAAEKQRDEKVIILCLKSLADLYENQTNYKEALIFYKRLHEFELNVANKELEVKKKDLLDSVRYAYRIQTAVAPPEYLVDRLLPKHFILYMPKDVVSGDFYFISEFHNKVLFAAVDCTGHGVPGALMSVIGFNCLTQAVRKTKIDTPGKVLSFLDESVNEILRALLKTHSHQNFHSFS